MPRDWDLVYSHFILLHVWSSKLHISPNIRAKRNELRQLEKKKQWLKQQGVFLIYLDGSPYHCLHLECCAPASNRQTQVLV